MASNVFAFDEVLKKKKKPSGVFSFEETTDKNLPPIAQGLVNGVERAEGATIQERESVVEPIAEASAAGLARGTTFAFEDEIAGATAGAWAKASGKDFDTAYQETRDAVRNWSETARSGAPIAAFLTEVAGSQLNPLTRGGSVLKTIGQGFTYGVGSSIAEDPIDLGVEGAISGATSGVLHGSAKFAKGFINKKSILRARAIGANASDFKNAGKENLEKSLDELNNIKFFKGGEYDIEKGIFVKSNIPVDKNLTKLQRLNIGAEDALGKINKRKELMLNQLSNIEGARIYNSNDFLNDPELINITKKFKRGYSTPEAGAKEANKVLDNIKSNIDNINGVGKGSTLADVDEYKTKLQDMSIFGADDSSGGVSAFESKAKNKFVRDVSRYFRIKVENEADALSEGLGFGKEIKRLNSNSKNLITANNIIKNKIPVTKAGGDDKMPVAVGTGPVYLGSKLSEKTVTNPSLRLGRAELADMVDALPQRGRDMVNELFKQGAVRSAPTFLEDGGREPQSIPMMLQQTPLERTTDQFLTDPKFVRAKIAQSMPEMYSMIDEALNNDPAMMRDVLPMLPAITPSLFRYDKYNRFDGIIADPAMKQKAVSDTMKMDNLSNTEKMSIINRLNKTGEYDL